MEGETYRKAEAEELPEMYQQIAGIIGIENAIRLSELLGGQLVYFPKLDSLMRLKRDKAIRAEFNGKNFRELARRYCVTEQWIRRIVRPK